jgi:hypothetical protein
MSWRARVEIFEPGSTWAYTLLPLFGFMEEITEKVNIKN